MFIRISGKGNAMKKPDLDSKGRDRNDYARCKMCGVSELDKKVELQPSRSALIFGAFPGMRVQMEYRCADCEKKVCKSVSIIKNL
jgi:DNA-directed RNA polymerase subunit RPC12/RpoP